MILPYRSSGTTTAVCQARFQKVSMVRLMGSVRRMARPEILVMVGMEEFQVLLIFPKYKARALVSMTKVAECREECAVECVEECAVDSAMECAEEWN